MWSRGLRTSRAYHHLKVPCQYVDILADHAAHTEGGGHDATAPDGMVADLYFDSPETENGPQVSLEDLWVALVEVVVVTRRRADPVPFTHSHTRGHVTRAIHTWWHMLA